MSEEETENLENLSLEELERRIKQGNYPIGTLKRYQEKLEEELREEQGQEMPSESILRIYKDPAKNKEIVQGNNGSYDFGEWEGYLKLYLWNDSEEGLIKDIDFSFEDKAMTVVQLQPEEIEPKTMATLTLNFHPSKPRGFRTKMHLKYSAIYRPPKEED